MPPWLYALLGGWLAEMSLRQVFVALSLLCWAVLLCLVRIKIKIEIKQYWRS